MAGNALVANLHGKVRTGDGLPGGDFIAAISTFRRFVPKGGWLRAARQWN